MAFLELAHILWEATKPTFVLTGNKSVTRFFQTEAIPPALWNACDFVLQSNFKKAHIAESINTAAGFLSRLELKVTEKIRPKIREDNQTTPIEVTTSSSDVADEKQILFTQADKNDKSEEQILERKEQYTQNECEAMGSKWRTTIFENKCERIHKDRRKHYVVIHEYNQSKCPYTNRARCQSCAENIKMKILGQPHDEVLMVTDSRYKIYKTNEDRIIPKDGLFFRKSFGETGSVKYYQILIPKQLVDEVLCSLHRDFAKHSGIAETIIAYREKLFSKIGAVNQGAGHVMWAMYQRIPNWP